MDTTEERTRLSELLCDATTALASADDIVAEITAQLCGRPCCMIGATTQNGDTGIIGLADDLRRQTVAIVANLQAIRDAI